MISTNGQAPYSAASDVNSTTANLSGAATFVGSGVLNAFPDVGVYCRSDVAGTLYFDFSVDNTNWYTFPSSGFKVSAGIPAFHVAVKLGRYHRARYINGASAQSSFFLNTYYGQFAKPNAPLSQSQTLEADATIVRQIPSELDIDLGGFSDITPGTKFGNVEDIDAADAEVDIWQAANDSLTGRVDTKTFPASSSTFYMASTSAADTSITITIEGLASDGTETTVTTTTDATNGQTPVSLGTLLDVNRAYVDGDNETLAGNLWIASANNFTAGVPDNNTEKMAFIPVGYGQTQQIQISVPSDRRCRIKRISGNISRTSGAAGSAEFNLYAKESGKSWRVHRHYDVTTGSNLDQKQNGMVFGAGARITVRMTTNVSDTDTNANAQIDYELIDN